MILRESKRKSFRDFVSSIGNQTPLTKVSKSIRNLKGSGSDRSIRHLCRQNGTMAETGKEISLEFAERLSSNSSIQHYSPTFLQAKRRAENTHLNFTSHDNEHYNNKFTLDELTTCLSSFRKSAPGPDGISYDIIERLPRNCLGILLNIYNKIWTTQDFPDSWRLATVIPIPKPGKDHSDAGSYRPISLTSCLCKLMEKMVNRRLTWFLERYESLWPCGLGHRILPPLTGVS